MRLQENIVLYHSSYLEIDKIDLSKCADGKDFGKGFYLTSSLQQAQSFVKTVIRRAKNNKLIDENQNYGFINSYKLNRLDCGIPTYEFDSADKEWLWFISANRRHAIAKDLLPLLDRKLFDAEVIVGKVANDTTNTVITAYLNGLYGKLTDEKTVNFAIERLIPQNLTDQFCFKTERALSCLMKEEVGKYVI